MDASEVAGLLRALAEADAVTGTLSEARHDEVFSGTTAESASAEDLIDAASVAEDAAARLREEAGRRGGDPGGRPGVRVGRHARHRVQPDHGS